MRVAVAYDHRGRKGAESVKSAIEQHGDEYIDLGATGNCSVDCPDFAYLAAMALTQDEADTAILLCSSGIGMSISANKVRGIRAARCCDEFDARAARNQFDANVLCFSAELSGQNVLKGIVEAWLSSGFEERPRPRRLIRKIRAIEEGKDPRQVVETDD
jgi:ribose 5-phosphate isomerase B